MRWKSSTRRQSKANTTERMKRTKIVWWFSTPIQDLKGTPTPPSLSKTKTISNEMDKRMKQKYSETMTKTKKKEAPDTHHPQKSTPTQRIGTCFSVNIQAKSIQEVWMHPTLQWSCNECQYVMSCQVLTLKMVVVVEMRGGWEGDVEGKPPTTNIQGWDGASLNACTGTSLPYVSLRTYLWTSKCPCGRHGTKSTQSLRLPADVPVDVKKSLWTSWY